jgi:transcriptional regulator with GAF, ATPase, and Fis domain
MEVDPVIADLEMARLYALVDRLGPADLPVLITGETGCGKELVATALHRRSARCAKPMMSINCAALHAELAESELFGHEKGSFSGAVYARAGVIEASSGSTLFLDEVGELTLSIQAKLLRVLELHRVTRVGETRERDVDVRLVAATNRDLEDEVSNGRFRRDLYFRLSAATLHLPPLRDRPTEIGLLAKTFLDQACDRNKRSNIQLSDDAIEALRAHRWPGNVRELKNVMQYLAATTSEDVLRAEQVRSHLGGDPSVTAQAAASPAARLTPPPPGEPRTFRPLAEEIRELERTRIGEALVATGGNQTRAAELLAMSVRTFFQKAKLYGLTPRRRK